MIPLPTILLLGSGNVAWHLSAALSAKGCRFLGVYSRTAQHAEALAERLRCPVVDDLGRAPKDADVYLICTSDDSIASVSALLPENDGLTVHVSGAAAIDAIDKKHRRRGVIYPLQTFNKNNSPLLMMSPKPKAINRKGAKIFRKVRKRLKMICSLFAPLALPLRLCVKKKTFETVPYFPVFIETENQSDMDFLTTFARLLSDTVIPLKGEQRKILHIAAVFSCNFTNFMYGLAAELMQENGLDFQLLLPLIRETAQRIEGSDHPMSLQTGPAVRNDLETIQKHLELLQSEPKLQEIYRILTQSIRGHAK